MRPPFIHSFATKRFASPSPDCRHGRQRKRSRVHFNDTLAFLHLIIVFSFPIIIIVSSSRCGSSTRSQPNYPSHPPPPSAPPIIIWTCSSTYERHSSLTVQKWMAGWRWGWVIVPIIKQRWFAMSTWDEWERDDKNVWLAAWLCWPYRKHYNSVFCCDYQYNRPTITLCNENRVLIASLAGMLSQLVR